jgi:hypothetical protein
MKYNRPRSIRPRDLLEWYRTPSGKNFVRYALSSVISTGVSQGVLFLTFGILRLWSAVDSNVFANAVAVIPSYYLNRNWAWGKRGRSHLGREVVPFWVLAFAGMGLSMVTVGLVQHYGPSLTSSHLEVAVMVNAANFAAFAMIWVGKFIIYNRVLFGQGGEGIGILAPAGSSEVEESGSEIGSLPGMAIPEWPSSISAANATDPSAGAMTPAGDAALLSQLWEEQEEYLVTPADTAQEFLSKADELSFSDVQLFNEEPLDIS